MGEQSRRRGPRGGTTTVSESGLVRKTIWIHEDENAALRRDAYEQHLPETEIIRRMIRERYGIED